MPDSSSTQTGEVVEVAQAEEVVDTPSGEVFEVAQAEEVVEVGQSGTAGASSGDSTTGTETGTVA